VGQFVITELVEGVLRVEIRRPEKKNAFNATIYRELCEALVRCDQDPAVRVLLLHGQPGIFSAGHEVQGFSGSQSELEAADNPVMAFMRGVSTAEKPIVAAVDGYAIGVGATLLLHCDLVFASPNARFQFPFVNLGLCPELGSSLILPRLAGHQRASELLLLGEPFPAEIARELGLVNSIVESNALLDLAMTRARTLARQPAASVRLTKSMLKKHDAERVASTIEQEVANFIERTRSAEAAEAVTAFLEKRKPDFSSFS